MRAMSHGSSSIGAPAHLVSGGEMPSRVDRVHGSARRAIRAAGGEGGGAPPDAPEREGGLQTQIRKKTTRPDKYKVLLYNDDYTPMEFVVAVLEQIFGKAPRDSQLPKPIIHYAYIDYDSH